MATTFAAPFDILLTRYQSGKADGSRWGSIAQCVRAMVAEGGPQIFFRGWVPFFARCVSPDQPITELLCVLHGQTRA